MRELFWKSAEQVIRIIQQTKQKKSAINMKLNLISGSDLGRIQIITNIFRQKYPEKSLQFPPEYAIMLLTAIMMHFTHKEVSNMGFDIIDGILRAYSGIEKNVVVPSGVSAIGQNAFCGNDTVESVMLPASTEVIGSFAFDGCTNLREITLPERLREIGLSAFGNSGLQRVVLPDSIEFIDEFAFQGCKNLRDVAFPHKRLTVRSNAFAGTPWLKNQNGFVVVADGILLKYNGSDIDIEIPAGVKVIAEEAFYGNTAIETVCIPDSVCEIKEFAFANCSNLKAVKSSDSLKEVGCEVFRNTLLERNAPNGQVVVGDGILCALNPALKRVNILHGVKSLPLCIREYTRNLDYISLPGNVAFISENAFDFCKHITIAASKGSYAAEYAQKLAECFGITFAELSD